MSMFVYARTQFEGFHRWPHAPEAVAFLAQRHRHIFHVKVTCPVTENDREIEFILLKRKVNEIIQYLQKDLNAPVEGWSCEHWCNQIARILIDIEKIPVSSVDVSEDGENGAIWINTSNIIGKAVEEQINKQQRPGGLLVK